MDSDEIFDLMDQFRTNDDPQDLAQFVAGESIETLSVDELREQLTKLGVDVMKMRENLVALAHYAILIANEGEEKQGEKQDSPPKKKAKPDGKVGVQYSNNITSC